MPAIVVPHVVRYALKGRVADRPWVNIFDIEIDEGRPAAEAKIITVAEKLMDGWVTYVKPSASNTVFVDECSWVDLDSLGGGTGTITDTPTGTFPAAGLGSGDAIPGNVAVLVTKVATGGRASRNGRTFLAGISEAYITTQTMLGSAQTTLQTAMTAWMGSINASVGGVAVRFCVVTGRNLPTPSVNYVSAWTVQSRLATLSRRLRP